MEAKEIIEALGGKANITKMTNCMTRLRPTLADAKAVDWVKLRSISGILQIIGLNTVTPMIVLGPGKADKMCKEINSLLEKSGQIFEKNPRTSIIKKRKSKGFLKLISQVFVPLIPLLAGCGLLFGVYNIVFSIMFRCGWAREAIENNLGMAIFQIISSMFFVLLNVAICTQACEITGGNKFLGMVVGGIIAFTTTFISKDINNPILFTLNDYQFKLLESGRGGCIAAIAAGLLVGYCDKWLKKKLPDVLNIHFPSLISVALVGSVTIFLIQPVAGIISYGLGRAVNWFFSLKIPFTQNYGWHYGYIVIAIPYLTLVMLGMHHAMKPIEQLYISQGKPSPITTITSMGGAGQIGAAIGLLTRYGKKNKRLKSTTTKALPVSCLGIGEPMIYGVTLPLGRSFVWSSLGAGVGAIALGFVRDFGARTTDCNGLLGIIVDANPLAYAIGFIAAVLGGFAFAFIFGVKKSVLREYEKDGLPEEKIIKLPTYISTPCKGEVSSLENVKYGFLVKPKFFNYFFSYKINAPISGSVADVNHEERSITIRNKSDVEVKISLENIDFHYKILLKVGDDIIEGQPVFRLYRKYMFKRLFSRVKKVFNKNATVMLDRIDQVRIAVKLNNENSFKNVTTTFTPGLNRAETDAITVLSNYY